MNKNAKPEEVLTVASARGYQMLCIHRAEAAVGLSAVSAEDGNGAAPVLEPARPRDLGGNDRLNRLVEIGPIR